MRCLTLADRLREAGAVCLFVCAAHRGSAASHAEKRGHATVGIPELSELDDAAATAEAVRAHFGRADWIATDVYALGAAWERGVRDACRFVLAIDDLADRLHECDALLDQNLIVGGDTRYDGLVPRRCIRFMGPQHALIRPEFVEARAALRERTGEVDRALVSLGGSDPAGATGLVLDALSLLGDARPSIDVVVGPADSRGAELERRFAGPGVTFHHGTDEMARLMARADVAFGAGGSTAWERLCLGLPAMVFVLADNQALPAAGVAAAGAAMDLGSPTTWTAERLAEEASSLFADAARLQEMSRRALEIVGPDAGHDVWSMLRATPRPGACTLRPMADGDSAMVLAWRNSERVRRWMTTQHFITAEEHAAWWAGARERKTARHLMFESGGIALGVVNFTDIDASAGSAEWGFYIGEPWAPPRAGLAMGVLALDEAFGPLRLETVDATVLPGNEASLQYHRRLGFEAVGEDGGSQRLRLAQSRWHAIRSTVAAVAFGEEEI